ncbi:MinD/ParA family ATP-binding protein [Actinomadura xylanilytica]|nr:hypothetical protein [Actinomadura xylanilytica]MDL4772591.1 hypothetical protein [Actinomadura xylanilytica]
MLRRLGRGMRKGIGASAAGQARELARLTAQLGAPVPSCRRIVVTSVRGGAGKSTIAALVAGVIRRHRDDRVIAIDADPGLGSLPLRLDVRGARSLRDLAAARPQSWDETAAFLTRTEEGLWVLPAHSERKLGGDLDDEIFRAGAGRLGRYFSTSVIDCGAGLVSGLQRGVLSGAHAQVFVAPGTTDGAASARAALGWFAQNGHGPLLSRTVIALVAHTPSPGAELERAAEELSAAGLLVVHIPYDRHLAAGIAITPERVGGAARDAATLIAAEAFARSLSGGAT